MISKLRNLLFAAVLVAAAALPRAAGAVDHLFQGWDDVNALRIENPETGKGGKNLEYLGPMLRRAFYSTAASSGLYTVADRTALAAITKATLSATTALPGVTELVVRVTSDADSKPRRYRWKAGDSTTVTDYVLATGEGGTGRWFAIIDDTADGQGASLLDADFAGSYAGALIRTGSAAYSVLKHNLAAGAAPGATDDGPTSGYAIGSLWIDTTSSPRALYMAVDVTDDTAVWRKLADGTELRTGSYAGTHTGPVYRTGATTFGVLRSNATTSNPTVNDDSSANYGPGSTWLHTDSGEQFLALSVSPGAAVWRTSVPRHAYFGGAVAEDRVTATNQTTSFSHGSFNLPANVPVGTRIRASYVVYAQSTNGTDTLALSLQTTGGDQIASVAAYNSTNADYWLVECDLIVSVTGASGRLVGTTWVQQAGQTPTAGPVILNVNMSSSMTVSMAVTHSSTNAGNQTDLRSSRWEVWSL